MMDVMVSLSWTVYNSLRFLLLLSMILYICPLHGLKLNFDRPAYFSDTTHFIR